VRFAAHLTTEAAAILTFLGHPARDATNWRAEHALRPAIVTRKFWGGKSYRARRSDPAGTRLRLRALDQRGLDPAGLRPAKQSLLYPGE